MDLQQNVYSVLIVSDSTAFSSQLTQLMTEKIYQPVELAASVNEAQRKMARREYDLVLINTPLPDDFGVRFAMEAVEKTGVVVTLFVKTDFYDAVLGKVERQGVFAVRKPLSSNSLFQALDWLRATRERLRRMEKKTTTLQEKMDEIKLINRAKWALISHLGMSEEEAHRYIEKQAMDRCVTKGTVAQDILRTYKQ